MAYESNVEFLIKGIQGGQSTVTQLEYHRQTGVSGLTASACAVAMDTIMSSFLLPYISNRWQLVEIEAKVTQILGGVFFTSSYVVNPGDFGVIDGDALPPNVTAVLTKIVDNTTIEPISATPFRNGFVGFSGIPEAAQDDGLLSAFYMNELEPLCVNLRVLEVSVSGNDYEWTLGLERGEVNPDKVLVADLQVRQKLGTRNSRKR